MRLFGRKLNGTCYEVVTITIAVVAVACALMGWMFGGSKIAKNLGMSTGNDTKTQQSEVVTTQIKPVYYIGEDGKPHIMQAEVTQSQIKTGSEATKMSLFDKIKAVGIWWIGLTILGWFIAPIGLVMSKINAKAAELAKESEAKIKAETVKIVQSVQAARSIIKANPDTSIIKKMDIAMDNVQNDSTKALVADIKTNGTITK